jgi:hypothetical protein
MELAWTRVVGFLLAAWWVASTIHQLRLRWWWRVERHDALSLLPRWSFFAPSPGRHDLHLVFRDQLNGSWTTWQSLPAAPTDRRWWWLWNPERYSRKALSDFANGLRRVRHSEPDVPRVVLLSAPYLSLLGWIMAQPRPAGATHRQFAVVNTQGFDAGRTLDVLFVSEAHRASA